MKSHPLSLVFIFSLIFSFQLKGQLGVKKGLDFGLFAGTNMIQIKVLDTENTQADSDFSLKLGYNFGFRLQKSLITDKLSLEAQLGLEGYNFSPSADSLKANIKEFSFQPIFSIPLGNKDQAFKPLLIVGGKTNLTLQLDVESNGTPILKKNNFDNNFSGSIILGSGVVYTGGEKIAPSLEFRVEYQLGLPNVEAEQAPVDLRWNNWSYSILAVFMFKK